MRGGVGFTSVAAVAAALAASGCSANNNNPDVIAGKQLFASKCGSCHVLNRAGTKGVTGPDLDEAFQEDVKEDFGSKAIESVIYKQILYPARPGTGGETGVMPANLVKGQDAHDVAAYVARSVAQKGPDTGKLATAVKSNVSKKPAVESNGTLTIPADPGGNLAFVNATATASAGTIKIVMPNMSGTPHNIAIDGEGKGAIVPKGDSTFTAAFKPGKYTYYCQVPGHEAAGMKGTLVVK